MRIKSVPSAAESTLAISVLPTPGVAFQETEACLFSAPDRSLPTDRARRYNPGSLSAACNSSTELYIQSFSFPFRQDSSRILACILAYRREDSQGVLPPTRPNLATSEYALCPWP